MKSPLPQSRINHPFLRRRVCRSRDTYELRREFDGVSNPRQLGYIQRPSNLLLVSQTVGTMIAAPCRPRSFWPNSRRSSWRSLRLPNISMGGTCDRIPYAATERLPATTFEVVCLRVELPFGGTSNLWRPYLGRRTA
jgi:hypothetical protein